MKNLNKLLLAVFFVSLLCSSCSSGFIYTLHTDSIVENRKSIKKVICINPSYRYFLDRDFDHEDRHRSHKLNSHLSKSIVKFAQKKGFDYEIFSGSSEADQLISYYKDLLPLKNIILHSLDSQDNPLNEVTNSSYKKITSQKFVIPTQLPAELSNLAEKYDTPYFALFDIYTSPNKSFLYHIVVDLNLGQIEYQEIKGFSGSLNKTSMKVLVYDCFYFMRKHLKK